MDDTQAFARQCGSKIRHPSREAALMALEAVKKKKGCIRKVRLTVYLCRYGTHWHVGRSRKKRKF